MIEFPIEDRRELETVCKALKNQESNSDFQKVREFLSWNLLELDKKSRRLYDRDEACRSQGARLFIEEFLEMAADANTVLKRMSAG